MTHLQRSANPSLSRAIAHERRSPVASLVHSRLPPLASLVAVAALVWLSEASSASAQADAEAHTRQIQGARPELHMSVGGHGDIGAGFRVDVPIVPGGFLPSGRDEFALSPGLDIQFVDFDRRSENHRALLFIPQLATQWNFYFPRGWSIFPELGLGVVVGDEDHGYGDNDDTDVHVDPLAAFGARKHFGERTALVMRAGWPSGLQLGFAI